MWYHQILVLVLYQEIKFLNFCYQYAQMSSCHLYFRKLPSANKSSQQKSNVML